VDSRINVRRRALMAGVLAVTALGGHTSYAGEAAQAYPTKPVRLIVPLPAGGASDVVARLIGKYLSEKWGQPVVVENKSGANGNIGAAFVAKSEPDGYTLLLMDLGSLAISPSLYPDLNYQPTRDLAPVSVVAYSPHILVVRKDLPVNSVADLVAYAHKHPNKLNYGETPGAITHLAGVLFAQKLKVDWNYIGYKGGAQVIADVASGQIDATFNSYLATYPLVAGGRMKLLAVASPKRFSQIPDTPTVAETIPDFVTGSWQGLLAPAGTPTAVIDKIHADIAEIVARPELKKRFEELGSEKVDQTPAQFKQWLIDQTATWGKIVRDGGVKLL
jgi:tripartite-type tricarboxylate transporter receptor subunit TctC